MKLTFKLVIVIGIISLHYSCEKEMDYDTDTIVYGYVTDAVSKEKLKGTKIYVSVYEGNAEPHARVDSTQTDSNGYYEMKFHFHSGAYKIDNNDLWLIEAVHPSYDPARENPTLGTINSINFNMFK